MQSLVHHYVYGRTITRTVVGVGNRKRRIGKRLRPRRRLVYPPVGTTWFAAIGAAPIGGVAISSSTPPADSGEAAGTPAAGAEVAPVVIKQTSQERDLPIEIEPAAAPALVRIFSGAAAAVAGAARSLDKRWTRTADIISSWFRSYARLLDRTSNTAATSAQLFLPSGSFLAMASAVSSIRRDTGRSISRAANVLRSIVKASPRSVTSSSSGEATFAKALFISKTVSRSAAASVTWLWSLGRRITRAVATERSVRRLRTMTETASSTPSAALRARLALRQQLTSAVGIVVETTQTAARSFTATIDAMRAIARVVFVMGGRTITIQIIPSARRAPLKRLDAFTGLIAYARRAGSKRFSRLVATPPSARWRPAKVFTRTVTVSFSLVRAMRKTFKSLIGAIGSMLQAYPGFVDPRRVVYPGELDRAVTPDPMFREVMVEADVVRSVDIEAQDRVVFAEPIDHERVMSGPVDREADIS